jgi:hypothetical protein
VDQILKSLDERPLCKDAKADSDGIANKLPRSTGTDISIGFLVE